ncbi:hypothetical protein SDC9_05285 [bioreactor metagenome]|uniref:Uncharacterized protein n=1 Tax=bioreactor metagenome TaxID=1076179 RepID=A0A644SYG3_9ZZZZ
MMDATQTEIAGCPPVFQSFVGAMPGASVAVAHTEVAARAAFVQHLHAVLPAYESIQKQNLKRPGKGGVPFKPGDPFARVSPFGLTEDALGDFGDLVGEMAFEAIEPAAEPIGDYTGHIGARGSQFVGAGHGKTPFTEQPRQPAIRIAGVKFVGGYQGDFAVSRFPREVQDELYHGRRRLEKIRRVAENDRVSPGGGGRCLFFLNRKNLAVSPPGQANSQDFSDYPGSADAGEVKNTHRRGRARRLDDSSVHADFLGRETEAGSFLQWHSRNLPQ